MSLFGLTSVPDFLPDKEIPLSTCPFEIKRPVMEHYWNDLTFIHWAYDPEVVQELLPPGLSVDLIDDRAWVSLVPFHMRVDFTSVGRIPYFSEFPETNVRTYVTAHDGTRGIYFYSLDAARLSAVMSARAGYRLPYYWSQMKINKRPDSISYSSRRRFPGPHNAHLSADVSIGTQYQPNELSDRDHLLSARWKMFLANMVLYIKPMQNTNRGFCIARN